MTTLDARARRAAHSIHAGVAEFTPAATFDAVVIRQQRWRTFQAAFAGAVTAAIIVIAGIAVTPANTPEVADLPVTVTTVPTPEPEVIPPVVVPSTSTTTTTLPAETTTTTTVAPQPATTTTTSTTVPPDTIPPRLEITSPKPDEHFEVEVIEFRGITEPGATVFAGQYEANVDREGKWSIRLVLSPGANGARFVATDAAGNQTEA